MQLHPPSNFESKKFLFNIQDLRLKRTKPLHRAHVQQNQGPSCPGPIKPPPLRHATARHFRLRCIIGKITPAGSCIIKDACMFGCTAKANTEHKVCNGRMVCVLYAYYRHLTTPNPRPPLCELKMRKVGGGGNELFLEKWCRLASNTNAIYICNTHAT